MVIIIVISLLIHLGYYVFIFSRLIWYKGDYTSNGNTPVSIVICYKNEAEKIKDNMPYILAQEIEEYIFVNDFSTDQTGELLSAIEDKRVKIVRPEKDTIGKKQALHKGISTATNDKVLLTDADCKPVSQNWATIMHSVENSFILGYAPTRGEGWLGKFASYETFLTGMQYLSYALSGIPYMGVGRNMIIDRNLVLNNQEKIKGQKLASGDDDLTINALSDSENTSICIHPDTFMVSKSPLSFSKYIHQKTRHVSTSTKYKMQHIVLLSLFSASLIVFYLGVSFGFLFGLLSGLQCFWLLVIKWGVQWLIAGTVMKKFNENHLILWYPILDVMMTIYYLVIIGYATIRKKGW